MCPLCFSKKVRRSHRTGFDLLLLFLLARPMRCRICSHRYYRFPWSVADKRITRTSPADQAPSLTALRPQKRAAAAASSSVSGRN